MSARDGAVRCPSGRRCFNLGRAIAKAIISAYLSFFPVLVGMIKGLRSPDAMQIDLLSTYGASGPQTFWKLRLPASMPYFVASLKVAIAASLVGAIVGELPTGAIQGLGARMLIGSQFGRQRHAARDGITCRGGASAEEVAARNPAFEWCGVLRIGRHRGLSAVGPPVEESGRMRKIAGIRPSRDCRNPLSICYAVCRFACKCGAANDPGTEDRIE